MRQSVSDFLFSNLEKAKNDEKFQTEYLNFVVYQSPEQHEDIPWSIIQTTFLLLEECTNERLVFNVVGFSDKEFEGRRYHDFRLIWDGEKLEIRGPKLSSIKDYLRPVFLKWFNSKIETENISSE